MGIRNQISNLKSQPFFVNVASLGLVQIANYIIPLLIIPIIARALGVDFFGKASYAQNIIAYLTIIVNYGFEYSATQDVAINRDDKNKLRTIFWTVIRFKSFLLLITFILLGILYLCFSKVNEDPLLYFFAAIINIGVVLFPTWFFQGVEKMKNMAIFNFIIKALGAILILFLVKVPDDYRIYILVLSLSYVFVGIISFFYVIKKYDLSFNSNKKLSKQVVRKGFPIFVNNIFISLYAYIGITIIGIYMTDTDVGIYSGAYKIIQAVIMLTCMPISFSLFPIMSRKFNESKIGGWNFFKNSFLYIIIFAIIVWFGMFIFSPIIVRLFLGSEFLPVVPVLRFMSVIPSLVIIATILTVQGLYGLQLQKYSPILGIVSGIVSLILNLIFIPILGIYGAVIGWIAAQVVEISISSILILTHIKKHHI